ESVGTPVGRVILFGTIPITIPDTTPTVTPPTTHVDTTLTPTEIPTISPIVPPSPDYTPTSPDYSPASDTEFDPSEDLSLDYISPLPATLPFLSLTDDSSDTSGALRRRVMILAPGQPIPHGRPYHYHPNRLVHMMIARKRVRPLPTYHLAMRHLVDYSSSDLFTSDDSAETSSDSSSGDLSDSSYGHSSSDHSSLTLPLDTRSSHYPSRKRSKSPTTSIPISSPIPGALSPARADLLPPPKSIRSSDSVTDLEDCSDESSESSVPKETSLRDDVVVRGSDEPYSKPDIDPEIQATIDECIAYTDALRAEGIDVRVVVETVAREEVETSARDMVEVRVDRVTHLVVLDDIHEPAQEEGTVEVTYETLGDMVQKFHDHTMEIPVHRVHVIESIQRDQGHRIIATGQQSVVQSERISELERDNMRLKGMMNVASQRVNRFQRRELRV
ncbi:hypothetical protein Tco_1389530, partial [Tanacetum coccineum]